jgi:hypothetical protein
MFAVIGAPRKSLNSAMPSADDLGLFPNGGVRHAIFEATKHLCTGNDENATVEVQTVENSHLPIYQKEICSAIFPARNWPISM